MKAPRNPSIRDKDGIMENGPMVMTTMLRMIVLFTPNMPQLCVLNTIFAAVAVKVIERV